MKFKKEEVMLGEGLLSDISKSEAVAGNATIYIDIDKIVPNELNKYGIEEIEEFAEILHLSGGIKQDLIVKPVNADGTYTLTTGERRWRGAKLLREQGRWDEKFHGKVPCKIEDPEAVELPLPSDLKEMFSILCTNKYRDKTDGDKMMEIREWKKIFTALREKGIQVLSLKAEEENEVELQKIKGVSTRELVARQTGMSTGQISRFENVEKHGSEELIEGLLSNKVTLPTAEKVVELTKEEQKKFMEAHSEEPEITKEDVENHGEPASKELTKKEFENDIKLLKEKMGDGAPILTTAQYKSYKKHMAQLGKLLES